MLLRCASVKSNSGVSEPMNGTKLADLVEIRGDGELLNLSSKLLVKRSFEGYHLTRRICIFLSFFLLSTF